MSGKGYGGKSYDLFSVFLCRYVRRYCTNFFFFFIFLQAERLIFYVSMGVGLEILKLTAVLTLSNQGHGLLILGPMQRHCNRESLWQNLNIQVK